jgi:hypothetical protein
LSLKEIKNDNLLGNKKLADVLWRRKEVLPKEDKERGIYEPGDFGADWVEQLTDLGMNMQIVAHTPDIAAISLRAFGKGNENGMFYDRDGLMGASLQSNCGTGMRDATEYFVLDLDNDELIIEEFDNMGNHVQTLRQKTPPQKSGTIIDDDLEIGRRNPAGDYHKYEKKVISILKKEGGAAGLDALKPAFPKKTTKAKARSMLKKMNHVVQHQDGDYILVRGISNPRDWSIIAKKSIEGTPIQPYPGPKGEKCGGCAYLCPETYQCKLWTEKEGRPVYVDDEFYCKAYMARPKMNKPIGAFEFGVGVSLLGGIYGAGKLAGPYVSHLLAKRREKKLSDKIVGDVVGELKPLIESLGQRNEEAVAYSVAKQMTPSQIEQLGELQDEMGDEIEPEVEEFFDEIIEQSEVQVRYHIIETPHGTYKYDEKELMMEVPVGDDDKVMSWVENNMQEDNPNLYHDVTIEGDTATYKLKKKARRNVPFDTTELHKKIKEDDKRAALRELKQFGEDYIDDELQLRMKHYERSTKYEIVYSEQSGAYEALMRVLNALFGRRRDAQPLGKFAAKGKKFIEIELKKLYNAKAVALVFAENNKFTLTFTMKERRKRKNPQLPACSYRKSKRSKACGGKLRAKKNPKGRIVCTDCGAEYEMR